MSSEVIIRSERTPWGATDYTRRLVTEDVRTDSDVRRLAIDRRVRFVMFGGNGTGFGTVFSDMREDEISLVALALDHGAEPLVTGEFHTDPMGRGLFRARLRFPESMQSDVPAAVRCLFAHVDGSLLVPPHHAVFVNGTLRYGYWTSERKLVTYYPAD